MFAQVALEQVPDQLFTYLVPDELKIRVGQKVRVPWRRTFHAGYVIHLTEESPYRPVVPANGADLFGAVPARGIRAIETIEDPVPYFSEGTIRLLRWLADYYSVGFTLALKSALPSPVRENGSRPKECFIIAPRLPLPPHLPPLTKRLKTLYEDIVRVDGGRMSQLCTEFKTTPVTLRRLAALGYISCERAEIPRNPLAGKRLLQTHAMTLTTTQAQALDAILSATKPILLFGVTGSGKTEVYMQAIAETLKRGESAIVLVPEISLTPQTVGRFAARFGKTVAVLHSALSDGERHDEWHRIRRGEAHVVVGPRSAVFAPVCRLGLIIVDEEHDSGYKQDESPRYSARDVAVVRAAFEGATCVLGSATPSLESWFNATQLGKYRLVRMAERVGGSMLPSVYTIDMREASRPGEPIPIFSQPLLNAMKVRLQRGEQTILFLNRRGYAPTFQCPRCGHVFACRHCSAKLTYHAKDDTLRCHLCGTWQRPPEHCPECGATVFKQIGFGTQRIEQVLRTILPNARVIRMDADSTSRRHSHDELLSAFRAKEADILVGTQMIAKGLDFPNVTLVGILAADRSLNIAYDFRAAERTFQLIAQVSGRAGRGTLPGEVYVQTFQPNHPAIRTAADCAYEAFANEELCERKTAGLPPFCKLACITFVGADERTVAQTAHTIQGKLEACRGLHVSPAEPAPLERKEDLWRWQILVRASASKAIVAACDHVLPRSERVGKAVRTLVDIDAVFLN